MDINEVITLDALTPDSVSVLRQSFITLNGEKLRVGENTRNAYSNTERDRELLAEAVPYEYYAAVVAVWDAKTKV